MPITLENCQITSYQLGVLDNGADAFDFSQLTIEPTAPQAGEVNHSEFSIVKLLDATTPTAGGVPKDWIEVVSCQVLDNAGADGKGYLLTSIQHSATDTSLIDQSGTEASSRLFVRNLTLDSQASLQTAFVGGVRVASGDVNGGDGQHDDLLGCAGSDWTLDFQPQLTTEPTASEGRYIGDCESKVYIQTRLLMGDDAADVLTTEPTASEDGTTKVYSKTLTFTATVSPPGTDGPLTIGGSLALGPINLNDGPEEDVAFYYGKMDGQTFDDLAIDPNNPNKPSLIVKFDIGGPTDSFDISQLTTEPTAPAGEVNHNEFRIVKLLDATSPKTFDDEVLVAFEHGDTHDALGDPVTFTYTVRNTSSAYEGIHVLYQDVVVPSGEGSVPKGDWIADVTYNSVEVLGQPTVAMETLTTAHEGFLI